LSIYRLRFTIYSLYGSQLALVFCCSWRDILATVDMAFGQLSDVGLRRLPPKQKNIDRSLHAFPERNSRESLSLQFHSLAAIQILLVVFSSWSLHLSAMVFRQQPGAVYFAGVGTGAGGNLSPVHPACSLCVIRKESCHDSCRCCGRSIAYCFCRRTMAPLVRSLARTGRTERG